MLVGIDEIVNSRIIGIPTVHMRTLLNTADKINHIISFRSVSPLAHEYIQSGHPTKPFHIKNKSSQNGPAAGLIPASPLFGRPTTSQDSEKYLQQIAQAKQLDPLLIEGQLILSKSRIEELMSLKRKQMQISYDEQLNQYTFVWHKNLIKIIAYANWGDEEQGYKIIDDQGHPIRVLGHIINGKFLPITADYDLLMIGFKREEWDPKLDQPTFRFQASIKQTLFEMNNNPQVKEDPKKGNVCERTSKMITMINQDIYDNDPLRKLNASPIVHHNQEAHNPFGGDVNDDFPCLFLLPSTITGQLNVNNKIISLDNPNNRILLVENTAELSSLYNLLTNQHNGFYLPVHPKYKKNKILDPFKPEQYHACEKAITFNTRENNNTPLMSKNQSVPSEKKNTERHPIFLNSQNSHKSHHNVPMQQNNNQKNKLQRINHTALRTIKTKPSTKSWHK